MEVVCCVLQSLYAPYGMSKNHFYRPFRYNSSKVLNKRIRIGFSTNAKEGTQMVMERIDLKKAQAIAKNKGLKPGKVKGTEGVQFTKGKNDRLTVITWEEFENILAKRGLAIYESGGWMKIMKA